MKLSEFKAKLNKLEVLRFENLRDHFHITEVGVVSKDFVDCGGTKRVQSHFTMQVWFADDTDHRLPPKKLLDIIEIAKREVIAYSDDLDVEVEYQGKTIGRWGLMFDENRSAFVLTPKQTDCLAKDKCGIEVVQNDCCSDTECC